MPRFYLIELAYRSINFLNFLNVSLDIWNSVPSSNEKNEKYSLSQKQMIFRINNDSNLIKYQENEKKNEDHPHNPNYEKIELIRNWAQRKKINSSKELPFEEINELNNTILKEYIDKLQKLKKDKNQILQLLFPQLIKSLFDSFNLLYEIKTIILIERKNEINKYTKLLLDSDEKEKKIKNADEKINKLNKAIQKEKKNYEDNKASMLEKIKKEKQNYEDKISSMLEQINMLTKDNENLKKEIEECKTQNENNSYSENRNNVISDFYNSILLQNEVYQSDINLLNNKINTLEITFNSEKEKLINELNTERAEREKLKTELNNERNERVKLTNELNTERAERVKFQKDLMKSFEDNNNEMMMKLKEQFEKQKEELIQKFQLKEG